MYTEGWDYFAGIWNFVDFTQFLIFGIYFFHHCYAKFTPLAKLLSIEHIEGNKKLTAKDIEDHKLTEKQF